MKTCKSIHKFSAGVTPFTFNMLMKAWFLTGNYNELSKYFNNAWTKKTFRISAAAEDKLSDIFLILKRGRLLISSELVICLRDRCGQRCKAVSFPDA